MKNCKASLICSQRKVSIYHRVCKSSNIIWVAVTTIFKWQWRTSTTTTTTMMLMKVECSRVMISQWRNLIQRRNRTWVRITRNSAGNSSQWLSVRRRRNSNNNNNSQRIKWTCSSLMKIMERRSSWMNFRIINTMKSRKILASTLNMISNKMLAYPFQRMTALVV